MLRILERNLDYTRWSCWQMHDFTLVVVGIMALLMLIVFAGWLISVILVIILLPIYLLGILQPAIRLQAAIRMIALGLQQMQPMMEMRDKDGTYHLRQRFTGK